MASISTASCSSPKEFTQAVPPQEAVLTLKAMVLNASPMHIITLISPLSGVAFARNSSYSRKRKKITSAITIIAKTVRNKIPKNTMSLTRLSPISHRVTREEFFAFETFTDDLGMKRNVSPNSELDFRRCHAF